MPKQIFTRLFLMVLAFVAIVPEAWAEEEELILEEVIVTAVRRDTNLMETPLAVSALTADALAREGVSNIVDVGNLVPNMQVGLSPSDSGVSIAIRGITSNNFTELGDPTVESISTVPTHRGHRVAWPFCLTWSASTFFAAHREPCLVVTRLPEPLM